jgi:hypothetical protein
VKDITATLDHMSIVIVWTAVEDNGTDDAIFCD